MSAIVDTLYQTLRSDPASWQFRLALVEALLAENRIDEATSALAEPAEWPADPDSQIKAARAFGLLDPAKGLGILEPIIQSDPTCAAAHFEKAFLSFRTGDHQIAKRHYFTALTFDPSLEDKGFEKELAKADPGDPGDPAPVVPAEPAAPADSALPVARAVVEAGREWDATTPLPVVAPEPEPEPEYALDHALQALEAEAEGETDDFDHLEPAGFPVQTLRAALETRPVHVRPLVCPDSIPPLPALVHEQNTVRHNPNITPKEVWSADLHNVYVQPTISEGAVVYDYQHPDESIFEPHLTPDEIYVVAPEAETGEPAAHSLESLLQNRRRRDLQIARQRRRNKVGAAFTGVLFMAALFFILWMIKLALPQTKPPEIVATTSTATEKVLRRKVIPVQQASRAPTPPSSAAPMPLELITAASASVVAVPNIDSTDAISLELGTSFGSGAGFGSAPGSGNSGTFFGSKVTGGMAVVFDITGSMYSSNPRVVAEINRKFKTSQVVAVFGATFRDVGGGDLVPYKKNADVLANVERNGKNSATQLAMNKALFSLSRCDSLNSKGWQIQSLGKAIEALLNQPLERQPRTIFVFSDFQDGVDLTYMEKVQQLVKRRRAKIVFYHPVAFGRDEAHYREFAKQTGGEVKEGLPKP